MPRTALRAASLLCALAAACSGSSAPPPPPNQAPVVDVTEPLANEVLTGATVLLSGKATDDGGAPVVEYSLDGATWTLLALGPGGAFSTPVALPDGANLAVSLTVRARDGGGLVAQQPIPLVVSNRKPTLTVTAPAEGALLGPAAVTTVAFTGTALDAVTLQPATVMLDFGDGAGARNVPNGPGGFALDVPLGNEDHVAHAAVIVATDARGNQTSRTVNVIVDRVAPRLAIVSPAPGEKFNQASFATSPDVPVSWNGLDGDPSAKLEVNFGGGYVPVTTEVIPITTQPTDDGVLYTVRLRASDTAGNSTTVSRSFGVDRVAPVATFDPIDGSRLALPQLTVTFSEPVAAAAWPIGLTPAPTPAQQAQPSPTTFAITQLAGDTVYTATLAAGAVADAYGNANAAGATVKFHTRPAQPGQGASLLITAALAFDAVSDQDGVVTLLVQSNSPTVNPMVVFPFGPKDGIPYVKASTIQAAGTRRHLSTSAWSSANADLSAHRAFGFQQAFSAETLTSGLDDGSPYLWAPGDVFYVPVAPGCADPAGLPATGVVTASKAFVRGPSTEAVGVLPHRLLVQNENYWELVGVEAGVLTAQARSCVCLFGTNTCSWKAARTLAIPGVLAAPAEPRLSVTGTAAGNRRLYVTDDGAGSRHELCECSGAGCPANGSQSAPAAEGLYVASARSGNLVIGARKTAAGVELVQRDLQASCTGAWTVLGTAPGSAGASVTEWRPAMFGDRPGVLWLDGTYLYMLIP